MSKLRDLGISLVLAVALVSFLGIGIPLVSAFPFKEKTVSKYIQPNVMQVTAHVYCQYTGGQFIESTYSVEGSITIVAWPHALLGWGNDNSYDYTTCYSEQYGWCAQWPWGTQWELTSYAEISI
ncbi:MAG: hypothetical protein ACFFCH_06305 [Promethearchaeota archaeon]